MLLYGHTVAVKACDKLVHIGLCTDRVATCKEQYDQREHMLYPIVLQFPRMLVECLILLSENLNEGWESASPDDGLLISFHLIIHQFRPCWRDWQRLALQCLEIAQQLQSGEPASFDSEQFQLAALPPKIQTICHISNPSFTLNWVI